MEQLNNEHDFIPRMPLIGDIAPQFYANTTNGKINFPNDLAGHWIVFFSHPSDFTPVCTTEFVAFQNKIADFAEINTVLVGLSVGANASHLAWIDVIAKMKNGVQITFPLIDDLSMNVAKKYGMIHPGASDTNAVRAVFIIDPSAIIRTILYYPPVLGRNIDEIYRAVVALQTASVFGVATPADWTPGENVLTPAPTQVKQLWKHDKKTPWFLNYKKLSKDDIYRKIRKQKSGK
ncbi:MAG: peroxiredoxin [Alphaproteobacteria bacterium]|nr:peroxiredoxin [Alphaproteobacteria bacterium]